MPTKRDQEVSQLISQPSGEVKALLDQLAKIQTMNNTLHSLVNASLSQHCRVINLRKNTLVIAATSPAWATKLRFLQSELLSRFRQAGFFGLANIEIQVRPESNPSTTSDKF